MSSHTLSDGGRLSAADHQGRHVPCGQLFVHLQWYPRTTHPKLMEGSDINIPFNDQVPYRVWDWGVTREPSGRTRMLHCHAGDGGSPAEHVYRRATDNGGTVGSGNSQ